MRHPIMRAIGAIGVAALATACVAVDAAHLEPPEINVVTVTAGDFFFQMPDTLKAGLTSFRLVNKGKELHHIQAVRLADGKTLQDLVQHFAASHVAPAWATEVGGPNTGAPGAETEATFHLRPGTYAILCVIPSPDGTPHLMKGMMKQVTVVTGDGEPTEAPRADIEIVLDDYSFEVTPALRAGRQVVRVDNRATQPHEILLARLAPGKTPADLITWAMTPDGPPPGEPIGGTTALAKGEVNYLTLDLAPGEYGLICFIPDSKDGKPHFEHGMVTKISVK